MTRTRRMGSGRKGVDRWSFSVDSSKYRLPRLLSFKGGVSASSDPSSQVGQNERAKKKLVRRVPKWLRSPAWCNRSLWSAFRLAVHVSRSFVPVSFSSGQLSLLSLPVHKRTTLPTRLSGTGNFNFENILENEFVRIFRPSWKKNKRIERKI